MPPRRSSADKQRFAKLLNDNYGFTEACRIVGIDPKTGRAWRKGIKDSSGISYEQKRAIAALRGPIPFDELNKEARKGWDDFGYFRHRYLGRRSSPWQEDAGHKLAALYDSPEKEHVNLNCPPGAGKSTLVHDIQCWVTVRRRDIRGIMGSATHPLAVKMCLRLRRTFERTRPTEGAEASLVQDYGRFQPDVHDLWRQDQFVIAQFDDVAIDEKEPTWQAFGLDTRFLGNRGNFVVWDDVITKRMMRTAEALENLYDIWDNEAETRCEPGGLNWLVGQRLGPTDIYAYNKKKLAGYDELLDDEELDEPIDMYEINPEGSQKRKLYHSFVYPAHWEDRCKGEHKRDEAKAWPEGCLLDPDRLPWRELKAKQLQSMGNYRTVYQQEDSDPSAVLVPRWYVTGGEVNGESFPGCYDDERDYRTVPKGLGPSLSVCTVDMSPTKFWCVQWWLYNQPSELRYLMDLERSKMTAGQFLEYDPLTNSYSGVLETFWQLSRKLGRPFTHLIIERNGAQRFLMQLEYFRRWCSLRGVHYHPHDTGLNKSDPEYGVQSIAMQYRLGRVRLPNSKKHGDMGFIITRKLVDEVTVWPDGTTDDCVMAQWFLEWWIPKLVIPDISSIPDKTVPSWLAS